MARFTARSSLTEVHSRNRQTKRCTKRPPSSFARHATGHKVTPSSRAKLSLESSLSYVFVGNLRADVRNEHLEKLFKQCGKVLKIDIRCCSGNVAPSASNSNTVYATVTFLSVEGSTQALFMDGKPLLGKKIVVAPSFFALPEATRVMRRKPISVCGFNLTKISDNIQQTVDRIYTGGTQIFPTEEEED